MQTEEQHGEGVALRFVEYGEEIGATHEQEGSDVVQRVEEVDWRHHQTPQDHHQSSEVLVHSLEQPVQSQGEEDSHGCGEEIADDAETEEPLVGGDVAGRRGRVPMNEKFAGNIDEAHWPDNTEEQVPESGDSPWVA